MGVGSGECALESCDKPYSGSLCAERIAVIAAVDVNLGAPFAAWLYLFPCMLRRTCIDVAVR